MIPNPECAPDAEPCCTGYYDAAKTVVDEVLAGIVDCIDLSCGDSLYGAVLFSRDFVLVDSLSFVVDRVRVDTKTVSGRPVAISTIVLAGRVRLLESGYPMIITEGPTPSLPSVEEFERAAMHLIAHGERLHRRLLGMRSDGTIPGKCVFSKVGDLTPIAPQSGTAGWEVTVEAAIL